MVLRTQYDRKKCTFIGNEQVICLMTGEFFPGCKALSQSHFLREREGSALMENKTMKCSYFISSTILYF